MLLGTVGFARAGNEDAGVPATEQMSLAAAPRLEHQTLDRLLHAPSWTRRAIAAIRLERYRCSQTRLMLEALRADETWQVRVFAVHTLGRRGADLPIDAFDTEEEPRVLRVALRHGYGVDIDRLGRGVRYLARSNNLQDKMLAVELGVASDDPDLYDLARETFRKIILRMGRAEGGSLSPRLAAVTGQPDMRRHFRWQKWLRRSGRNFELHAPRDETDDAVGELAALDPQQFAALEGYIDDLSQRSMDLAICIDCTASMAGEIAEAQGGIDDLMIFAGDVVKEMRVAVVAYRDRRSEFETKGWDFTSDIALARRRLWSLAAAGGGDTPEAVYEGLRMAYARLSWLPKSTKVLVLVGDAPPHVGYGGYSVRLAQRGAAVGITTHVIEADSKPVKYFPEIAEAGGGRCVSLKDRGGDSLIVEIAGLTLGDRFDDALRAFFRSYLDLCR